MADKYKRFRFIVKCGRLTSPSTCYSDAFAAARRLARKREKGVEWPEIEDTQAKPGRARRWQVVSTGPTAGDTVARVIEKAPAELTVEPVAAEPTLFPAMVFLPANRPRPEDALHGLPDTVFQYAAVAYEGRRQLGGDWPAWVEMDAHPLRPKFIRIIADAHGLPTGPDAELIHSSVRSIVSRWAVAWVAQAALMAARPDAEGVDNAQN